MSFDGLAAAATYARRGQKLPAGSYSASIKAVDHKVKLPFQQEYLSRDSPVVFQARRS